jgi:hypothetical protein
MRENALIVASLLTRSLDSSYSCVIQAFIAVAWQQRREAKRRDELLVHGSVRLGSARFGSARHCLAQHGENTASSAVA